MRSGWLKSWIAAPSRRNSGFDTTVTSACGRVSRMIRSTSSPVPTGTVDLVTTTVKPESAAAISRAAAYTQGRSAWPAPRGGAARDEPRVALADRAFEIGGEVEPAAAHVVGDEAIEIGLEDRDLA